VVLLRETGFSFGGVHSRDDMGLIYVEKEGHIAIPEIKRNSYTIAGMSGTLLLSGEAWQPFTLEGSLFPAEEPATQAEAQALLRNILSWLTAGRQRLIFDYEPEVYYMAELMGSSKWTLRNWFGGELQIRFLAQPFAYSVNASTETVVAGGGPASVANTHAVGLRKAAAANRIEAPAGIEDELTIKLDVETDHPTGLELTVTNTGEAAITSVGVEGIQVGGLELRTGQRLVIDTNPPASVLIDGENAMANVTDFAPIWLYNGVNLLAVRLAYDGSDGTAQVTASARGRW